MWEFNCIFLVSFPVWTLPNSIQRYNKFQFKYIINAGNDEFFQLWNPLLFLDQMDNKTLLRIIPNQGWVMFYKTMIQASFMSVIFLGFRDRTCNRKWISNQNWYFQCEIYVQKIYFINHWTWKLKFNLSSFFSMLNFSPRMLLYSIRCRTIELKLHFYFWQPDNVRRPSKLRFTGIIYVCWHIIHAYHWVPSVILLSWLWKIPSEKGFLFVSILRELWFLLQFPVCL